MRDPKYVIEAEGLTRRFGSKRLGWFEAVHNLSLRVEAGSVYGLLGRNGSGKTTTIRLLLGLLWPDEGHSWVLGEESRQLSPACRQRIGYVSESGFPYDTMPLAALVRYVSTFFDRWDWPYTNHLVQRFDLPTQRPLRLLSRGQQRQCELLLALAQKPDLLILDDPALGLDVTVRREFLEVALEVAREEGKAVLFSSHVLSDVERIVDTVGMLEQGQLLYQGSLDVLKACVKRCVLTWDGTGASTLPKVEGELCRTRHGQDMVLVTCAYTPELESYLRFAAGLTAVQDMNLEEIFMALTARFSGRL